MPTAKGKVSFCLPNRDVLVTEGQVNLSTIREGLHWSLQAVDLHRGANFYIKSLKGYLSLKYDVPADVANELVQILFTLVTYPNLDMSLQAKWAQVLTKLLRKSKKDIKVTLPWKPIYELIVNTHFDKSRSAYYTGRLTERYHVISLVSLARRARRFFDVNAAKEIMEEFRPFLCPHDSTIFKTVAFLNIFLPTHQSSSFQKEWIPELLAIWAWIENSGHWDNVFTSLISRIIKDQLGVIDWTPYSQLLYTNFLRIFDLAVAKGSLPKPQKIAFPKEAQVLVPFHNNSFGNIATAVVYMLSPNNSTYQLLSNMANTIKSYYHPSNGGDWTDSLSIFLNNLCYRYAKRASKELSNNAPTRLTQNNHDEFTSTVWPLIMHALYSKRDSMTRTARSCIKILVDMKNQDLIPKLLDNIFAGLETVTATHQTLTIMETLGTITDALVKHPQGAENLNALLSLSLPGIDFNDIEKTKATFKFYYVLLSNVPVSDEAASFSDWSHVFLERVFNYLSNVDKGDKSGDFWWPLMFASTIRLLFMQSSDSIYDSNTKYFHRHVTTSIISNAQPEFRKIAEAVGYAQPAKALKLFIPHYYNVIVKEVNGQTTIKDLSESELIWDLNILSGIVRFTGKDLVVYKKQIANILSVTIAHDKKKVVKAAAKFLKCVLLSLSTCYPKDYRSLPPNIWDNASVRSNSDNWSKLYTYQDADVVWHVPDENEIAFAAEIVQHFTGSAISEISSLIAQNKDINVESLKKALYKIRYVLRGAATIIPDFKEEDKRYDSTKDGALFPLKPMQLNVHPFTASSSLEALRTRIAETMHLLCDYVLRQRPDQATVLVPLVAAYDFYLNFNGVPPRYHELNELQKMLKDKWANYPEGNVRHFRSLRVQGAYLHYLGRLNDLNFGKPLNIAHHTLMQDLLQLATNPYPKVRSKSNPVLMSAFKRIPLAANEFLPSILNVLLQKVPDEESGKIEGAIQILQSKTLQRKIVKSWKFLYSFVHTICQTYIHDKLSIQTMLYHLFVSFCVVYYYTPLKVIIKQDMKITIPSNSYQAAIEIVNRNNSHNEDTYNRLVGFLLNLLNNKPDLHWKYSVMASTCLSFLIREDVPPSPDILLWFTRCTSNELAPLRMLSLRAIDMILSLIKPKESPLNVETFYAARLTLDQAAELPVITSESDWDAAKFKDKNSLGWNAPITLVKRAAKQQYNLQPYLVVLEAAFSDVNNVEKFLRYLSQDHRVTKSEGSNEQSGNQMMRMLGFAARLLGNQAAVPNMEMQAASEILREIIRMPRHWPYTKTPKLSVGFNEVNAHFWKRMFQLCKEPLLEKLKQYINVMHQAEEAEQQCAVAEIIAGLIRASKHWSYARSKGLWAYIVPVLEKSLNSSTNESLAEWSTAVRYAVYNMDPRRLIDLIELLFSDLLNSAGTSSSQAKKLLFINNLLTEFSWRAPSLNLKLLHILSNSISHPFKQVRHVIGECLSTIFINLWHPSRSSDVPHAFLEPQLNPKLIEFVRWIISRLEQWDQSTLSDDQKKEQTQFRETILYWLTNSFAHGESRTVIPYLPELLPWVFAFQRDQDEEISKQALYCSALIAQAIIPPAVIPVVLQNILKVSRSANWHTRGSILPFLQIFAFNHSLIMYSSTYDGIFQIVIALLSDPQIEVRELARVAISSLVKSLPTDINGLMNGFIKLAATPVDRKKPSTDPRLIPRHAGVLGLCAIVESAPYDIPEWMPAVLSVLSSHVNDPVPIKDSAKRTFADFWRTHQDTWQFDKNKFSSEQLDNISELLISPSYYA